MCPFTWPPRSQQNTHQGSATLSLITFYNYPTSIKPPAMPLPKRNEILFTGSSVLIQTVTPREILSKWHGEVYEESHIPHL